MNQEHTTTSKTKGQHLTKAERKVIQKCLKAKEPVSRIAKLLDCHRSTIYREIKRNQMVYANGRVTPYDSTEAQRRADLNKSRRDYGLKCTHCQEFIQFVSEHFHNDNWSFDVCYARALSSGFSRNEVVSVKTLYNYVNRDYSILHIRNLDLPIRVRRAPQKRKRLKKASRLGTSIEHRPSNVELRQGFGHWEIDTVLGPQKDDDGAAILTVAERLTRFYIAVKIKDKSSESVNKALAKIFVKYGHRNFLTITSDNGSEFSGLSSLENRTTKIFFAHPYSAYERGTNERHNGILRRWIPKGKSISNISQARISQYQDKINNMPRRILNYRTPKELFEKFAATKPSYHHEILEAFF